MNRLPSASTRCAPSPRTASETSGCWRCAAVRSGRNHSAVGWNCTNSRSVTTAPARSASATPSPVDTDRVGGRREDLAHAAGGQHDRAGQDRADAVLAALAEHVQGDAAGPAVGVRAAGRGRARARPAGSTGRARPPRAARAGPRRRSRRRRRARSGWRGGRPRGSASASRPDCGRTRRPSAISSRTRAGPSVTSTSTAAGSHSPTPATRVSAACSSGVSYGSSTAAMPPCAQRVEPSSMWTLVTTVTCSPASRRCSAAVSPATPEPTTTTSVVSAQPGSGAGSRRGRSGKSMPASQRHRRLRAAAGPPNPAPTRKCRSRCARNTRSSGHCRARCSMRLARRTRR